MIMTPTLEIFAFCSVLTSYICVCIVYPFPCRSTHKNYVQQQQQKQNEILSEIIFRFRCFCVSSKRFYIRRSCVYNFICSLTSCSWFQMKIISMNPCFASAVFIGQCIFQCILLNWRWYDDTQPRKYTVQKNSWVLISVRSIHPDFHTNWNTFK